MRRFAPVLAALLLVFGAVGGGPSAAATRGAALVITGEGNRSGTLTLPAAVTLRLNDQAPSPDSAMRSPAVRMGGSHAGFMLHDSRGRYVAGAVAVRGFAFDGKYQGLVWIGRALPELALRAGTYRVTLVADGAATVSIPMVGLRRGISIRPLRPTPGVVAAQRVDLAAPVPVPVARSVQRLRVPARQWLVAATFQADRTPSVQESRVCVAEAGGRCLPFADDRASFQAVGCCAEHTAAMTYWQAPGTLRSGDYDIGFTLHSTGVPRAQLAFLFTAP